MKTLIFVLCVLCITAEAYAFQRYNPFEKEWQGASDNATLQMNSYTGKFEYREGNN